MKLIGRRSEAVYLVEVEPADGFRMARVLDLDQGRLFLAIPLDSIVARGYWEDYVGTPGELDTLLARVQA